VPSYERPQYGGPPQRPTYPVEPPSFFVAPGRPYMGPPDFSQPYTGQPPPSQPFMGQPNQGQPYMGQPPYGPQAPGSVPPYGPAPTNPQPDLVPAKFGIMAIVAVGLIAVIGIGVAVWSMTLTPQTPPSAVWTTEPSSQATKATPSAQKSSTQLVNCSGSSAGTTGWLATVPAGWTCQYEAGAEIFLVDAGADTILVRATNSSAETACTTDLARDSTVKPLADSTWGGRVAKVSDFTYGPYKGEARCAFGAGFTFVMVGIATGGSIDQVVATETALAQSWHWQF
jgi:hypothetical protein